MAREILVDQQQPAIIRHRRSGTETTGYPLTVHETKTPYVSEAQYQLSNFQGRRAVPNADVQTLRLGIFTPDGKTLNVSWPREMLTRFATYINTDQVSNPDNDCSTFASALHGIPKGKLTSFNMNAWNVTEIQADTATQSLNPGDVVGIRSIVTIPGTMMQLPALVHMAVYLRDGLFIMQGGAGLNLTVMDLPNMMQAWSGVSVARMVPKASSSGNRKR